MQPLKVITNEALGSGVLGSSPPPPPAVSTTGYFPLRASALSPVTMKHWDKNHQEADYGPVGKWSE